MKEIERELEVEQAKQRQQQIWDFTRRSGLPQQLGSVPGSVSLPASRELVLRSSDCAGGDLG
jgi:hypothetical protein